MFGWLRRWWNDFDEWDDGFPDSDHWTDRIPLDADCPDTQPTSPGALESLEDVMKTIVLTVVILTLTGCATIPGLEITEDERKACETEGCSVWTRAELEDLVRAAMLKGIEAARKQRGSI